MSDLRIILLVLGVLFVAGLYCWEVFFKNEPKRKNNILDAVDDMPDLPSMHVNDKDDPADYSNSLLDLGHMIKLSRRDHDVADAQTAEREQAPVLTRSEFSVEPESSPESATQTLALSRGDDSVDDDHTFSGVDFDLFSNSGDRQTRDEPVTQQAAGEDIELETEPAPAESDHQETDSTAIEPDLESLPVETTTVREAEALNEEQEQQQLGEASDDLIVLYITSPAQTLFNGLSISKAAEEVGMVYGHMNVFHHFGPGKLHSGQPLFSMANMFEPGSFDLGRMVDLKTKGVVLFMYSPASIEPKVVFELFLNTSQRLAELLNGELRTPDNRLLNSATIQSLRRKAESLSEV